MLLVVYAAAAALSWLTSPVVGASPCFCDKEPAWCEIGCCCDPDCSAVARGLFTCEQDPMATAYTRQIDSCVGSGYDLVYTNNYMRLNISLPKVFCIERDNHLERNFWREPKKTDWDMIRSYDPTWVKAFKPSITSYEENGEIYIVRYATNTSVVPSLAGILALPTTDGGVCFNRNIGFLEKTSGTCRRTLQTCEDIEFAPKGYTDFAIMRNLELWGDFRGAVGPNMSAGHHLKAGAAIEQGTQSPNLVIDRLTRPGPVDIAVRCTNVTGHDRPCPPFEERLLTGCGNIVKAVHYSIIYDNTGGPTDGITRLCIRLDVTEARPGAMITQKFTTSFHKDPHLTVACNYYFILNEHRKSRGRYPISGNPGYLGDKPIVAGTPLDDKDVKAMIVSNNTADWITQPTGRSCLHDSRIPVNFRINSQSGCSFSVVASSFDGGGCESLRADTLRALLGNTPATHVGMYGNAAPDKMDDWLAIEGTPVPATPSDTSETSGDFRCHNVPTEVAWTFVFARTGEFSIPQNKIVGAKLFVRRQTVMKQCLTMNCDARDPQPLTLRASATFIDDSRPAVDRFSRLPVAYFALPDDFFYPLYLLWY